MVITKSYGGILNDDYDNGKNMNNDSYYWIMTIIDFVEYVLLTFGNSLILFDDGEDRFVECDNA